MLKKVLLILLSIHQLTHTKALLEIETLPECSQTIQQLFGIDEKSRYSNYNITTLIDHVAKNRDASKCKMTYLNKITTPLHIAVLIHNSNLVTTIVNQLKQAEEYKTVVALQDITLRKDENGIVTKEAGLTPLEIAHNFVNKTLLNILEE